MTTPHLTPNEESAIRDITARFLGQFSILTAAFDHQDTAERLANCFTEVMETYFPEATQKQRSFYLSHFPYMIDGFTFRDEPAELFAYLNEAMTIYYELVTNNKSQDLRVDFEFKLPEMAPLLEYAKENGHQIPANATHFSILFAAGYVPDLLFANDHYTPAQNGIPQTIVSATTTPLPLSSPSMDLIFPSPPMIVDYPVDLDCTIVYAIGVIFYAHDGNELLLIQQGSDLALFTETLRDRDCYSVPAEISIADALAKLGLQLQNKGLTQAAHKQKPDLN